MPENNLDHSRAIGEKLRAIRKQRRMSLRELANKAEVSASMLSQIETGKAYPSVRSIYSIAAALAVPVDCFFPDTGSNLALSSGTGSHADSLMTASEMREAKVNHSSEAAALDFVSHAKSPTPVVHPQERSTIELRGGITWSRLTALAEAGAEFLEITYNSGATSGASMSHHQGREFGLILEGELTIELGFESYTLRPGDSIIFDSTTPHRLTNHHVEPMRALWVIFNQP